MKPRTQIAAQKRQRKLVKRLDALMLKRMGIDGGPVSHLRQNPLFAEYWFGDDQKLPDSVKVVRL